MKKVIFSLGVIALLLAIAPSFYAGAKGINGPAGKSNKAHLYLYEKTPSGEWPILEDGAWGKMTYDFSGEKFNYVFNGHELAADEDYTLIYYPDPWPGNGLICLGEGTVNEYGDVHIMGNVDTGDLPSIVGSYTWNVLDTYYHDIFIETYEDGHFEGVGGYPAGGPYTITEVITGTVDGDTITIHTEYNQNSYSVTAVGTISEDGHVEGTDPWQWEITENLPNLDGAKIWLVLSSDVKCEGTPNMMNGWNPTEYLFENELITFDHIE